MITWEEMPTHIDISHDVHKVETLAVVIKQAVATATFKYNSLSH